ncbi:MAG TPA: geranylgeranyl reductase family protein [Caldithrix abyssi]|uniref:Geranylgeranyl reductase family protein n=1 Tax=Caldithrix abyssi TaxID=187145 RepID=A0A7V4WVL1_CALAY|nr:geranylgeranyl reductase family protein [Caldithrix abyssi]
MTQDKIYDLIVVGAGPAGSAVALYAAKNGLSVLLLDKAKFPRDKICGDAISGKSMMVLRELDLLEGAKKLPSAYIDSVVFGSPTFKTVQIPLRANEKKGLPPGLVIRREVFDGFLFEKAAALVDTVKEQFEVQELMYEDGRVYGVTGKDLNSGQIMSFRGKLTIGADGFNSVVARSTGCFDNDAEHWVVALRQYYKNVKGLNSQVELHYLDEVQPGYLWIFPADNGWANVGVGMLQSTLKKRRINLKKILKDAIESPVFRDRFSEAEPMEEPRGWNLPVGSMHRKNHGNGFLLLGDAAGLIDPFTGEGIGNALFSAKVAAQTVKEAVEANDFSTSFLSRYDRNLWNELGDELALSSKLQRIGRNRFLLNLVINKASRNKEVRQIISGMMADEVPKTKLANPMFYVRLLFS